jgi:hypothetical protein
MSIDNRLEQIQASQRFEAEVDRLSLEQALIDFEIANARVVDLTARLISLKAETDAERAKLAAETARIAAEREAWAVERAQFAAEHATWAQIRTSRAYGVAECIWSVRAALRI